MELWSASHGAVVQIVALTQKFGDKKGEPFGGISKTEMKLY